MDIETILSTERRLLEPICTFTAHEGYQVYKSDLFNNYYGGNGIDIDDPAGRPLGAWEEIFLRHFPRERFEHFTFTFPRHSRYDALVAQAEENGYHVEYESYLFTATTERCRSLPEGLRIGTVRSQEEWRRLGEFARRETADEDWNDPTATEDRLFEKTRFTSEAVGIEWFYIAEQDSDEILSSLGLFIHNGIGRLQDVRTAALHQRRGLATYLLSFAIRRAIETLGAAGVAVCADSEYYAIDLYRKLGFADQGESVCLMRYPVKNPGNV